MSKKCPPGVICIENITLFFIILCIFFIIYYSTKQRENKNIIIKTNLIDKRSKENSNGLFSKPNYSYSNIPEDILLNPYQAPLRDDRFFINKTGLIPINIETQSVDTTYRQVGILKRLNGPEMILPLMGKPLFTNRDKWNFYTMNKNNVKLPIKFKNKSCTNEYGCDNIYNDDNVYVDGIDAVFKATIYDNASIKYLPFV